MPLPLAELPPVAEPLPLPLPWPLAVDPPPPGGVDDPPPATNIQSQVHQHWLGQKYMPPNIILTTVVGHVPGAPPDEPPPVLALAEPAPYPAALADELPPEA